MNTPKGPNMPGDAGSRGGKAMSSKAAEKVYGRHSGYRKLKAYQVAELLYDFTCRFCDRYLPKSDRHHDQMVQAARSGYQNIAERIEERAANLGAILAAQAHWLTERLLDRHARDFESGGGFSERLYRVRTGRSPRSVSSVPSEPPPQQTDETDQTDKPNA